MEIEGLALGGPEGKLAAAERAGETRQPASTVVLTRNEPVRVAAEAALHSSKNAAIARIGRGALTTGCIPARRGAEFENRLRILLNP